MINSYSTSLTKARLDAEANPKTFVRVSATEWVYFNKSFYTLERDDDDIFPTLKYSLKNELDEVVAWFPDFDAVTELLMP